MTSNAQVPQQKIVRVGWYESPYSQTDAQGNRSGYAYEYQLRIGASTGWTFEYVEGTWPDLLAMLARGEIDILSDVTPLPERKASMLFSEKEMAYEEYMMMIPREGSGIQVGDPQTVNGKRIGIEKSSVQVSFLKEWLETNGVVCEIVELSTFSDDLLNILSQGEIDGLVAPTNIDRGRFVPAFRIGTANVHFAVNKSKPELKTELDEAMEQIRSSAPSFLHQLSSKYYSNFLYNVYLPERESKWLKQHGRIRIAYRDNYLPFCKHNDETGEVDGLLNDFIENVKGSFTNVDFEIEAIAYPTITEAVEAMKRGEADVAFPHGVELSDAEKEGLVLSDPLFSSIEMAVMRKDDRFNPGDTLRAGLNNNNPNYLSLLRFHYPHWTTVNYKSTPECLEGIAKGETDLMLLSSYRLGVLSQFLRSNNLKAVPTGMTISYGFVTKMGETELYNIISRLSDIVDENFIQSSIVSHSDTKVETTTREYIEQHMFSFFGLVLAILALFMWMLHRVQKERRYAVRLAAQQSGHIREIQTLNAELTDAKKQQSEALGMIEGLSQDYHTIWQVNKETLEMKLVRSSGLSTINEAIRMAMDSPHYDLVIERYVNTFVVEKDQERMRRSISSAEVLDKLQVRKIYSVNYLRRDESGNVSHHQVAFANADSTDGVPYFVLGFRDIEEMVAQELQIQRALTAAKEEAEVANAAKTSFLFNMSHDIRTPMNAIMGFTNLLRKHQEDAEKREDYLDKIDTSSHVLLSIINNVLEMARIEKGTVEFEESACYAGDFNQSIQVIFKEMMKNKGLDFICTSDIRHDYVCVDQTKLREIFYNILSNAYKYTEKGSVTMSLKELPSDREGYVIYQTTVSDTGTGMSEEFLPHIFDEFAREHNSTENKIEGTGLGMPIVKRLVDLMGGTVEVRSKKDVGTTIIVTLPHKIAEDIVKDNPVSSDIETVNFRGMRILLAEDNDLNAEIAIEILHELGFLVERAEDGQRAVDMLGQAEAGYYDAILMDIQMPVMNGYEATRAIRGMADPSKAGIPVIAMTANAFEEDIRNAQEAGMNSHLAKPIDMAVFINVLTRLLGQKG